MKRIKSSLEIKLVFNYNLLKRGLNLTLYMNSGLNMIYYTWEEYVRL